jgi:hypothetical protein
VGGVKLEKRDDRRVEGGTGEKRGFRERIKLG